MSKAAPARIRTDELSDGSVAHQVVAWLDGHKIEFACVSELHANQLMTNINECAWFVHLRFAA